MDREKAIQVLKRCEAESHCNHYKQHYCCIGCGQREALNLAIEALQEPKTGEWLPCTKNGLILTELIRKEDVAKWYGYKCSECNYIIRGNALIECSYCPNCGARMIGGDTE